MRAADHGVLRPKVGYVVDEPRLHQRPKCSGLLDALRPDFGPETLPEHAHHDSVIERHAKPFDEIEDKATLIADGAMDEPQWG